MSLFEELKRRNVIRVIVAYVVVAWLVMQVADVVLNNVQAPAWVFFVILLLLAIGFVFAIFFSWAFELTPEGVKREHEVDRTQSITHQTGQKLNLTIIGVLLLALAYFGYDKFGASFEQDMSLAESSTDVLIREVGNEPEQTTETDNSIAVLPFADMSPNKDQEYFSDGLSEELLNLLAKIPELRVAARTSAFSYKGKDVKISQIGEELGVAHVLEGSVRTAGDRIRVTAQLINVDDGFHLWSETYDRTLDDVFAIQDEISAAVVAALKLTLLGESPRVNTISPEAYALFLQAKYLSNQLASENYPKAVSLYKQVLQIEPDYAPAWAGLSRNYRNMSIDGQLGEDEGLRLAREAVEKALELDPNLAEAHARMGRLVLSDDQSAQLAAEYFKRAIELNPNDPAALEGIANFALVIGKVKTAVKIGEEAVLRDPVDSLLHLHLGTYYRADGRLDDAIDSYKNAINLNPDIYEGNYHLGVSYLLLGKPQQALDSFNRSVDPEYRQKGRALAFHALGRGQEFEDQFAELQQQFGEQWPSEIAHVYAWTGEHDLAFQWLDKAVEMDEGGISNSRRIAFLRPLHDDPRWQIFLEKVGVSDAQIAEIEFEF